MENQKKSEKLDSFSMGAIEKTLKRISPLREKSVQFELFYFFFSAFSILIQYVNLYKMNLYNYNIRLYLYSVLIFFRRVLLKYEKYSSISDPLGLQTSKLLMKSVKFIYVLNLAYLIWEMVKEKNLTSALFLIYYPLVLALLQYLRLGSNRYGGGSSELIFLLKTILLRIMEMMYFGLLLPWKCHDDALYFDLPLTLNVGIVITMNAALIFINFVLKHRGMELNFQAKALGCWKKISATETRMRSRDIPEWNSSQVPYKREQVVYHKEKFYLCISKKNEGVPGDLGCELLFNKIAKTEFTVSLFGNALLVFQNLLLLVPFFEEVQILLILNCLWVFAYNYKCKLSKEY